MSFLPESVCCPSSSKNVCFICLLISQNAPSWQQIPNTYGSDQLGLGLSGRLSIYFSPPPLLDHRNISSQHLRKILSAGSAGSLLSVSGSFCWLATISPSPPFTGSHWTQHVKICITHMYLILYRYVLTHFPIIELFGYSVHYYMP